MLNKCKIFIALTFVLTLIISSVSVSPSVAQAKAFTLKKSTTNFVISGKGGLFNKNYSFNITNTSSGTYSNAHYFPVGGAMGVTGPLGTGKEIKRGQTITVSFKGKGKISLQFQLQRLTSNNTTVNIDVPSGFSVKQL